MDERDKTRSYYRTLAGAFCFLVPTIFFVCGAAAGSWHPRSRLEHQWFWALIASLQVFAIVESLMAWRANDTPGRVLNALILVLAGLLLAGSVVSFLYDR